MERTPKEMDPKNLLACEGSMPMRVRQPWGTQLCGPEAQNVDAHSASLPLQG